MINEVGIDMQTVIGWALALLIPTLLYVARTMSSTITELRHAIEHLDGRLSDTDRRVFILEALTEERRIQRMEDKNELREELSSLREVLKDLADRMEHCFVNKA
jgi:predicted RNase H-like nuclease (RuvC/YqgF family)